MYSYNNLEQKLCGKIQTNVIPSRLDIDLTNVCNQDCFYCNSAEFRRKALVSGRTEFYYKLFDNLSTWKKQMPDFTGTIHEIVFTGGGEPTVHKDFHKIVEYAIDKGFMCQIITNASKLQKLIDNLPVEKIKNIRWIGVDIDAGNEDTYEKIRKSLTKRSLFSKVFQTVKNATKKGYVCDIKSLLMEENTTEEELTALFEFVKNTNANKLHLRPLCDYEKQTTFDVTTKIQTLLKQLSVKYNIKYSLHLARSEPRTYNKCHQMFLYPIICANGEIIVCCEGRGQKKFVLGNWVREDIRELWFSKKHWQIYNDIDVHQCPPCTPNKWNNEIQQRMEKIV